MDKLLKDAQVAALLNLEIKEFQSALRRGLIPPPLIVGGKRRWTIVQMRRLMGEVVTTDPAAAEAEWLEAIERVAQEEKQTPPRPNRRRS